jgi:hypothetical protein
MLLIGVVLVILGVIGLAYEGFTVTHEKKIVDIGPVQASKKEQETIPIPPILSWVAIGGGAVLIFAERLEGNVPSGMRTAVPVWAQRPVG